MPLTDQRSISEFGPNQSIIQARLPQNLYPIEMSQDDFAKDYNSTRTGNMFDSQKFDARSPHSNRGTRKVKFQSRNFRLKHNQTMQSPRTNYLNKITFSPSKKSKNKRGNVTMMSRQDSSSIRRSRTTSPRKSTTSLNASRRSRSFIKTLCEINEVNNSYYDKNIGLQFDKLK